MKTLILYGLALVGIIALHLTLGWQASLLVPIVVAWLYPDNAIRRTTLLMVASWGLMLGVSYWIAPEETVHMTSTVFSIISRVSPPTGDSLGWTLPLASILFAALLGALSGAFGSSLKRSMRGEPSSAPASPSAPAADNPQSQNP